MNIGYKPWGGVILNPSCMNRCLFCGPSRTKSESEIHEQEIKVAKNLIELKKQGISNIEISGGDPIEYSKIIRLIEYMRKIGFSDIQLSTHGRLFGNKKFFTKIKNSGLTKVRIPLYGSNPSIHDSITRSSGSFKDSLNGIKNLLKIDIDIFVSCLIMQQNKENLINLVKLLHNLKIKNFYFSIPCVSNGDYSYYVPIKDLPKYIILVYEYCKKIGFSAGFHEIPYCVLGKFDNSFNNIVQPPNLGKNCQPPNAFKTNINDLPSYRLKTKVEICDGCSCYDNCDGFFVNDVKKFGVGNLKPIK